jgi:hypothetical protein
MDVGEEGRMGLGQEAQQISPPHSEREHVPYYVPHDFPLKALGQ